MAHATTSTAMLLLCRLVQTGFGDNQSEWNAAYAHITNGKLHLMFTGNLQDNFNKLEIFIDSTPGGSTTFTSAGNDGTESMNGMVFDTDFAPDYHLIARRGGGKFDIDIADLNAPAFDSYLEVFSASTEGIGTTATGTVNASPIRLGYDNSNLAGVGGDGGQPADEAAALAVTTGLELSIALDDLGISGGDIRVMLLQNNSGHDFLANQSLAGLPVGTGNLEAANAVDFSTIEGDQFFTIPNGAPVDFRITSITTAFEFNAVDIEFSGLVPGDPYHIQRSTDLQTWIPVADSGFTPSATDSEASITTPADPGSREYYRITTGEIPQ